MTKREDVRRFLAILLMVLVSVCMLNLTVFTESAHADADQTKWLQDQIDQAPSDTETTITIPSDLELTSTVTIPEGKKITIRDDGSARTISGSGLPLFDVKGTLTIDASSDDQLTIQGGTTTGTNQATVASVTGTLNLKKGTVKGGTINKSNSGAICLLDSGTLNLSGSSICDTTLTASDTAPVFASEGTTINITGGSIKNNRSEAWSGSAAILAESAVLNMSGGEICDNVSTGSGNKTAVITLTGSTMNMSGGAVRNNGDEENKEGPGRGTIWVDTGGRLNLSGGEIADNYARNGGAAYVMGTLNMTGGTVSGNHVPNFGGGFYLNNWNDPDSSISGGTIENNTAGSDGGGMYINGTEYAAGNDNYVTLLLKNAVITENLANEMGGGVWCCQVGDSRFYASSGVAIFDNNAQNGDTKDTKAVGDDFVNIYAGSSETDTGFQKEFVYLSSRVLGGGLVRYYNDGRAYYDGRVGSIDPSVARYDASDPGDPVYDHAALDTYALKAVLSDSAKESALSSAKVIIRNNTARKGGGIASNGDLTSNRENESPDVWKLKVKKAWENVAEDDQVSETVYLKIGDHILDSVVLSKDNDWQAEFTDLPDPDTLDGKTVKVVEGKMVSQSDGSETFEEETAYIVNYSDAVRDDDAKVISMTITNIGKSMKIKKVNSDGELLKGASLVVTGKDKNGNQIDPIGLTTDGQDAETIELPSGEYTLTETSAPDGYEIAGSIDFTVGTDGKITVNGESMEDRTVVMVDVKSASGETTDTDEPTSDEPDQDSSTPDNSNPDDSNTDSSTPDSTTQVDSDTSSMTPRGSNPNSTTSSSSTPSSTNPNSTTSGSSTPSNTNPNDSNTRSVTPAKKIVRTTAVFRTPALNARGASVSAAATGDETALPPYMAGLAAALALLTAILFRRSGKSK